LFNIIFTISSTGYVILRSMGVADSALYMPVIKWTSFISSLLFLAYPGFMLSFVKAIPFWHSAVEPVLFFLQGVLGGTAVQLLMGSIFQIDQSVRSGLLKINYLLVIAMLLIILSALIIKSLHGEAERASVMYLLGLYREDDRERTGRLFLYGALIGGLVIPLLLLSLFIFYGGLTAVVTATLYTALVLELVGIYFAKYEFIRAGAYPFDTLPRKERL
jgi:formate-dependent nitrite reductase membrane component NrfD